MEAAEMKKAMKKYMKKYMETLSFPGLEKKVTLNGCIVYQGKTEIGNLGIHFLSDRCAEHGGLFALQAMAVVKGGLIGDMVDTLELSYLDKDGKARWPGYPMVIASSSETDKMPLDKRFARKHGTLSIFPDDDPEEKCAGIVRRLEALYVPRMVHFALGQMEVIEDIMANPDEYQYPMAAMMAACHLNGKEEEINAVIQMARTKKIRHSGQRMVDEVLDGIGRIKTS